MKPILSFVLFFSFLGSTIGQSVGTTEGVFNVSDMGAANYSIPIKVPDGINGMQPSLALVYNSQSGNGPLGMGWSISGLSAISRSGNNIYNDSKVGGVSLTNSDKFALDGNRLIITSGTYGASASQYRTEVETFKDIAANGVLGTGPLSFTVTDQNGWRYEYGNTTDSRQVPIGKTEAIVWYLNKVTDLNGNYMSYEYSNVDGEVLLRYVKYNCNQNTGLTYQSYVYFSYTTGTDPNTIYVGGGSIKSTKRIDKISSIQKVGSLWYYYRSYIPEYGGTFYTNLTKITEKGAEELEVLKPTEFTYGGTGSNIASPLNFLQTSATNMRTAAGDFNGDGKTDILKYSSQNVNSAFQIYTNNSNDNSISFITGQSGTFQSDPSVNNNYNTLLEQARAIPFDYNGDGYDDFVYMQTQNYKPCKCSDTKQAFFVYTSNGTALVPLDRKIVSSTTAGSNDGFGNLLPLTGDFDGDGKSEILLVSSPTYNSSTHIYQHYTSYLIGQEYNIATTNSTNTPVYLAKNLGLPFGAQNDPAGSNPNDIYAKPKLFVIDYDGDGKNEILVINKDVNNGTQGRVFALNVSYDANNKPVIGSPAFVQIGNNLGYPSVWHDVLIGDFNGDRISDVLTFHSSAGWELGYGNGATIFQTPVAAPPLFGGGPYVNNNMRSVIISDFNGDGKDDIYNFSAVALPLNQNDYPPKIYYSRGNSTFEPETIVTDLSHLGSLQEVYWLGDFSGDGAADFISRANLYTEMPYLFSFHNGQTRDLLSKVKNGLGSETKVFYKPLTNSSVYSPGSSIYTYPYIKRTVPFKVVSTVNADNVVNTSGNNTNYTYAGLKFNAHGKGLMGFDNVTSFDEASLVKVSKNFLLNTTYAFPYLQNTYTVGNNTTINTFSTSNGVYHYGNKRIFLYPIISEQYNALTGELVQTTNSYSFYDAITYGDQGNPGSNYSGKPFSITVNKGNGLEVSTQVFSFLFRLPSNSSGGLYSGQTFVNSKPCKVVTTNTRQGQTAYSRTDTFMYDATFGYLNQSISDPGTSNAVANGAYYDAYGNPSIKYTAASGLTAHSEARTYDPSHRYVTESYSLAFPNIKSKATYDALTGNKLTETAPDGFQTTYTYDAFGREKTTSNNNGLATTTSYGWGYVPPGVTTPTVDGAIYYKKVSVNSGAISASKFDRMGRELSNTVNNFQNNWVHTKKWFNELGQLAGITKPYYNNGIQQSITNTYDVYGRPTQISAPEGNTTYTYSAPGNNYYTISTTNPAGQTTKVKNDASGTKESTTDAQNNVLSYTYHSNGNVKSVTGAGTILQTYTYDAYNRLTERWDPNYGTYKYTYDAYGQTLTQTDPKNQVYSFKYDALGRMYQKTGPEGDYIYKFDNNIGVNCSKLILLTGPEGKINYSYGMGDKVTVIGYDDDGLVSQLTGNSLSNLQVKTFTYDNFGRLQQEEHWPTNTNLWYEYGTDGGLTQIVNHNTNTILYEKTGENAMGQITSYRQTNPNSGYELNTELAYDPYNLLTGQVSFDNSNTLRNMEYSFDAASGNLISRKDNKYGLEEIFSYDNLNRLESITNSNNSALDISMQFSTTGNIEKKSDVGGNLEYDVANRVSTINLDPNVPSNIPLVDQQLTYTPFDKVQSIDEGSYHTEFHYWPDGSRSMMEVINNDAGEQSYKIYIPGVETKYDVNSGQKTAYRFVSSPDGNIVGMVANDFSSDIDYFVLTDHLGSITQIVDEGGNIVEEKSFDAWGRLRNPQTWEPYASNLDAGQPVQLFDRGYTGHEHLACYGIINMNGRLYDPVMGRMFSPDPVMGSGGSLQGYNRYTYALNNPLKYTDPSGEYINLIIGAAIGGIFNWMSNGAEFSWKGLGYFGVGAAAGALGAGVGGGISSALAGTGFGAGFIGSSTALAATSSFYSGALIGGGSGLASGLLSGGGNAALSGGDIAGGALREGGVGLLTGGVIGGIGGGIDAVRDGRNFWHGGRLTYSYNLNLPAGTAQTANHCVPNTDAKLGATLGVNMDGDAMANTYQSNPLGMSQMEEKAMLNANGLDQTVYTWDGSSNSSFQLADDLSNKIQTDGLTTRFRLGYYDPSLKGSHSVGVSQVKIWDNGHSVIKVYDPNIGRVTRLSNNLYRGVFKVVGISNPNLNFLNILNYWKP